ncbi:MAG: hypothetical protein WA746_06950, partial [Isosphaeraceae bacterium]
MTAWSSRRRKEAVRQPEGCFDQPVIVLVEVCRQRLLRRQSDESSGPTAVAGMGADAPLLEEESTARLPLARQGANLVEKYKVS